MPRYRRVPDHRLTYRDGNMPPMFGLSDVLPIDLQRGIAVDIAGICEVTDYVVWLTVGEPLIFWVRREPPSVMFQEIEFIRVSPPLRAGPVVCNGTVVMVELR